MLSVRFVGVPRKYSFGVADLYREISHVINRPSVRAGTFGLQAATLQFGFHAAGVKILDCVSNVIDLLLFAGP